MFSLYHSSQKRILSCVLAVSDIAWSMYMWLVSDLMSPAWRHAALIVFPGNYFWCTYDHVSFIKGWYVKQCLLGESQANQDQLLLQISQSRKRKNSGTLKQFGPIFSKKWAKIKIQEQFSVRFTSQTNCLLMNMSHDVSRTRITVWLFNYPRNLVFFQPEV